MNFVVVLVTSVVILSVIFLLLVKLKYPAYRLRRENVQQLLQMVLNHQASESDWQVFVSLPIRYDDELEQVRQRCVVIEEQEYLGFRQRLFSQRGEEQLKEILIELQQRVEKEF